jgi:hypothetical protein
MEKSRHQGGRQSDVWAFEGDEMTDFKDETGNVYGRLTVIERLKMPAKKDRSRAVFLCRCACGTEINMSGNLLRKGTFKECGTCAQAWGKGDE